MTFYEPDHLFMLCMNNHRECLQKREYFRPVPEIPTSEFANDERVADNIAFVQRSLKPYRSLPQMRYPSRSVSKNHVIYLPSFCGVPSLISFRSPPTWQASSRFPSL